MAVAPWQVSGAAPALIYAGGAAMAFAAYAVLCGERLRRALGCAVIYVLECGAVVLRFGASFYAARVCVLLALLLASALSDIESMEIPDEIHICAVFALFMLLPFDGCFRVSLMRSAAGAAVIGGGITLMARLADRIWHCETLGGGDIKLFAVIGAYLGVGCGALAVALSCVSGLVFCAAEHVGSKEAFPFAPSIAYGAFAAALIFCGAQAASFGQIGA